MPKYYILNINYNKKSEVDYWLGEKELVPIFYGKLLLDDLRNNQRVNSDIIKTAGYDIGQKAFNEAKKFVEAFDSLNKEDIIFSIGNEDIYVFQQDGPLFEIKNDKQHKNDVIKCFKIKFIKKEKLKNCPLVLASVKCGAFLGKGTFRKLGSEGSYLGNIKALEHIINGKTVFVDNYRDYLFCLSSLEFETLVAKHLEELGFFVPAYKGGFLKNYDLFCRNTGENDIIFNDEPIKPRETLSVQIKLTLKNKHLRESVPADCYFCINSEVEGKDIYDWRYLEKNMPPKTKKWLETLLDWVKIK